jgi:hypothetical protein
MPIPKEWLDDLLFHEADAAGYLSPEDVELDDEEEEDDPLPVALQDPARRAL